jgi:O-methyltransferase
MTIQEIKSRIMGPRDQFGRTRNDKADVPDLRLTMVTDGVLDNVQYCLEEAIKNNIEGDFVETGVWRGGCSILAYHVIKHYNESGKRNLYLFDSYEGLPKPNPEKYPVDEGDPHWRIPELAVSLEQVKENFELFGEIGENVHFVKGWFRDTIPTYASKIDKIAVLRLDGDMYESTIDVLEYFYPKLSVGGFCIIDDYIHKGARAAVDDYRNKHNITDEVKLCDLTPGVYPASYWVKGK